MFHQKHGFYGFELPLKKLSSQEKIWQSQKFMFEKKDPKVKKHYLHNSSQHPTIFS